MNYKTVILTAPTSEPITLEDAKKQLRIQDDDENDFIERRISVARASVEKYCNRFFTEQEIAVIWECNFPESTVFYLPYPDLISVDAITYYDNENAQQTLTDFTFDSERQAIIADDAFPLDATSIRVQASTGAPAEFEGARIAMLMIMSDVYELRTESVIQFSVNKNPAVVREMQPYRVEMGV
jgi:uncharacterized phiE125 gp8 family phage protein